MLGMHRIIDNFFDTGLTYTLLYYNENLTARLASAFIVYMDEEIFQTITDRMLQTLLSVIASVNLMLALF